MSEQSDLIEETKGVVLASPEVQLIVTRWDPGQAVVASPYDPTWLWWWSPIVGPTATLGLSYLHHLVANGHDTVDLRAVGVQLGAGKGWTKNNPVLKAFTRLAAAGLINVTDVEGIAWIGLANPVRRPPVELLKRTEDRIGEVTA